MTNQSTLLSQIEQIEYEDAEKLIGDSGWRREQAGTLKGFFTAYLSHYINIPPADFHDELIEALECEDNRFILILGFRGSAKSTIGSLALPLWAALEAKYNFIIPIADTTLQAKINIANIKHELENNDLIQNDYEQMNSDEDWQKENMLLKNGVRILARSRGQKVRGLRHRQHRPELIIVDDPEDLEWVRTKENRDKTERWLRSEVIPAVEESKGRLILIGNLLHTDSLLSRMKDSGLFKVIEIPLINKEGKVTWESKYPTPEAISHQRKKAGNTAWQREYLLKVVPEEGQEVTEEDIHYYDTLPAQSVIRQATGVDLAISKKSTADFTTMVSGALAASEARVKIYIKPRPINARLDFQETIEHGKAIHRGTNGLHEFFIEDVAYQKVAIQEYERALLPVTPMKPINDKRARLHVAATYIKNGTVLFPREGCEDLLIQLLGFGVEEHDDLVDALVYLILGLAQQGFESTDPRLTWV